MEEQHKIKAASFDSMDYGELEVFEDIAGTIPTTDEELHSMPKSKLMIALGFIAERRVNPSVTLEEIKALPMGTIIFSDDSEDEGPS